MSLSQASSLAMAKVVVAGPAHVLCCQCLTALSWAGETLDLQVSWYYKSLSFTSLCGLLAGTLSISAGKVAGSSFSEPISNLTGDLKQLSGDYSDMHLNKHIHSVIPPVALHHS